LRQRTNDRSKLLITGNCYSTVTGEHDKAARTFHEMIDTYPRSESAYFSLGEEYGALGQYENGAEMTAKAQQLGPGEVPGYSNLVSCNTHCSALTRAQISQEIAKCDVHLGALTGTGAPQKQ